jgi:hypothetical protein
MLVNPSAVRKEYLARMEEFLARCRGTLSSAGVDYHQVTTDRALERTLLDLLVARSRLTPKAGPGRRAS